MLSNNEIISKFYTIDNINQDDFNQRRIDLSNNGYIVESIEIDKILPNTPTKSGFVEENEITLTLENLFQHLAVLKIYPVVYQGENQGRLVRHVVPRKGMENQISSYGSKESFLPHVDNPDLTLRSEINTRSNVSPCPDTLTLLCLRSQENVATSIIKIDSIIEDLTDYQLKLLQDDCFIVSRPASFDSKSLLKKVPLLAKDNGNYISRFDYHNVYSDSSEHENALNRFKSLSLLTKNWIQLYLKAGQVVTFDNQRVLHTRNGFEPKFDGNDRWLLRVFGLYNKPKSNLLVSTICNHHLIS